MECNWKALNVLGDKINRESIKRPRDVQTLNNSATKIIAIAISTILESEV